MDRDKLTQLAENAIDAHRWVVGKGGTMGHYPKNPGKWEYISHGFDIWIGFKGEDGETEIVFVVPCHWSSDHGDLTLIDLKEWIKDNLGQLPPPKGGGLRLGCIESS